MVTKKRRIKVLNSMVIAPMLITEHLVRIRTKKIVTTMKMPVVMKIRDKYFKTFFYLTDGTAHSANSMLI